MNIDRTADEWENNIRSSNWADQQKTLWFVQRTDHFKTFNDV